MDIYIEQYNNDNLLKHNLIRCNIYCMILDQLCFSNSLEKIIEIPRVKIENFIFTSIKRNKENKAIVNTVIGVMLMSGLISEDNGSLKLTQLGIDTYAKQTYHLEAANLAEAEASRHLARVAVIISIVTMVITIVSSFLMIYHR